MRKRRERLAGRAPVQALERAVVEHAVEKGPCYRPHVNAFVCLRERIHLRSARLGPLAFSRKAHGVVLGKRAFFRFRAAAKYGSPGNATTRPFLSRR